MLEIILSQCEICLTQLTKSSYKQRVTHWESRFQADLSSTCRHVGTLEAQFCRYYQNLHWMNTTQRKKVLKYTYIQSKTLELNWCTLLFSPSTELLGSNETESDTSSTFRQRTEKKCHILYQPGIIVYQNNVIKLGAAITRKVSTKRNISDKKSGVNM